MAAVDVRPADDSDVEAMAAIYVNAARAGWAHGSTVTFASCLPLYKGPETTFPFERVESRAAFVPTVYQRAKLVVLSTACLGSPACSRVLPYERFANSPTVFDFVGF